MKKLSDRQSLLGTETAFETLAKAKKLESEGKDIIHLEIGEPDFDTPDHIRTAAKTQVWDSMNSRRSQDKLFGSAKSHFLHVER